MMEQIIDIILDAVIDTAKLLPFLFITYLVLEYLEHKASDRMEHFLERAGRFGPAVGAVAGAVPQCGFSAAASSLYAGRVISVGTLFAVFLSTSDEMIPVMIMGKVPALTILAVVGYKIVVAMFFGFVLDLIFFRRHCDDGNHIKDICDEEHCHCEKGIFRSALHHTLSISLFILITNLILGSIIEFAGEQALSGFLSGNSLLSYIAAGVIGLIPNCAASVILTELYVQKIVTVGVMLSGLFAGSGVGLVVLLRTNRPFKQSLLIVAGLFLAGAGVGFITDLVLSLI